jgi:hypothetical protein
VAFQAATGILDAHVSLDESPDLECTKVHIPDPRVDFLGPTYSPAQTMETLT